MAFRFNYTDRKKILLSEVEIHTVQGESPLAIYLSCDFRNCSHYTPTDIVVIEANRFAKAQRVDLGAVGMLPAKQKVVFNEFVDSANVKYRIRVVDPLTKRLKGLARMVKPNDKPEELGDLDPILPVAIADSEDGLGDRFWKLTFPPEGPVLLLHGAKLTHESVKSNEFKALVWPTILREVLLEAFVVQIGNFPSWACKWKTFLINVLGVDNVPDEWDQARQDMPAYIEDTVKWIDVVQAAFSKHFALKDVEINGLTKENENG